MIDEAIRLAAWMNEACWHQMTLGDFEAAGRELRRLAAEVEQLKAGELKLHASLSESVLHAKLGWERYANANRLSIDLQKELESLRSERTAWRVTAENAEAQNERLRSALKGAINALDDPAGFWIEELNAANSALLEKTND